MSSSKKIKLLVIINNFLVGGVERLMLDLLPRLDDKKFDIQIVTVLGAGPLEHRFKGMGFPIHHLAPRSLYRRRTLEKAVWVLLAPMILLRIYGLARATKPDVVITSLFHADALGILASKMAGVPNRIFIQHDVVRLSWWRRHLKELVSVAMSTKIIAVSDAVKGFMISSWGVLPDKIMVIKNGLNLGGLSRLEKVKDIRTIGFLGRLEEIKGVDVFVSAVELLKEQYALAPEVLVGGEGSLRIALEERCERNDLNHVSFLGYVDEPTEFIDKIDIQVIPSRSEGFGLSALEGLLAHRVVIASKIPAFEELIIDEENALLFESESSEDLADKLASLFKNKEMTSSILENIDKWVRMNGNSFDIKSVAKEYEGFLISLVTDPSRGTRS